MSDWDLLNEMHDRGYNQEEIADAAGAGVAPWELKYIDREWVDAQLKNEPEEDAFSVEPFQSREGFPFSILKQAQIFHDLVGCAERHFESFEIASASFNWAPSRQLFNDNIERP